MAFQLSPGINVSEIDLTTVIPAVSTTGGAIAGVFSWGPMETPVLVTSENELVNRFGKPTTDNFETFFTAASFLAYGNTLYVSRAADAATKNAQANTDTSATVLIKNDDDFETLTKSADVEFYAKYAGALGNSLKASICDSEAAFKTELLGLVNEGGTPTFAINTGSTTGTITIAGGSDANADALSISSGIIVGDKIEVGRQFLRVTDKTVVENVITLEFASRYNGIANVSVTSGLNRYWEFFDVVNGAPGTSAFVADAGGEGDELHVVLVDEDGAITGRRGAVLEVFEGVSRATDAKDLQNASLYFETVINERSRYVYVGGAEFGAAAAADITPSAELNATTLSFVGGVDTADEASIALGGIATAWDVFRATEDVDISLVLAGKARGVTAANYLIDNIAEFRKDCVVFVSPELSDVLNVTDAAANIVDFRADLRASSYAVLDSGYKYTYDKYNDVYRYVPLNGDVAGLCARTDATNDPWFSPAGFNRGQVRNVVKLAFNPAEKATRDLLYKNDINPVVSFPGQGVVLYGDKTLLGKPSAFDRINVRRLFIVLEKAIAVAAQSSLFEFNDEFTRQQFRNIVEPFLRDVKGRRGITDFRVVVDETNNTGEVIDRNEFVGDIYIKPARSINFIQLNFVAVRTAVDFNEIVGQF